MKKQLTIRQIAKQVQQNIDSYTSFPVKLKVRVVKDTLIVDNYGNHFWGTLADRVEKVAGVKVESISVSQCKPAL